MQRKKRVKTLTKLDLVKKVLEDHPYNQKEVILMWIESVFTAMKKLMETADPEVRIEIRGFGVFEVKLQKEKPKARNPKTGEIVVVAARRKTHFKPCRLLKEFLIKPIG